MPSAMIEIRNDLVATPAGEAEWAARLASILPEALSRAFAQEPAPPGEKQAPAEAR